MKIYIMRHGETFYNSKGLIQGSADIELTEYGIELAEKTRDGFFADQIHFDMIFTSPLVRAVKTAEIINEKQGAKLVIDDRIREMHFGDYEGQHLDTLAETDANMRYCFTQPSKYVPTGDGESFALVYERMKDFFETAILPLEGSCDCILIVCHGALIRTVLTYFKGMDLDEFWSIKQPNCCVNLMELSQGKIQVVTENILYYQQTKQLTKRGIL